MVKRQSHTVLAFFTMTNRRKQDINAAIADLNAITEMIKAQANAVNGVIEWTR